MVILDNMKKLTFDHIPYVHILTVSQLWYFRGQPIRRRYKSRNMNYGDFSNCTGSFYSNIELKRLMRINTGKNKETNKKHSFKT